MKVGVSAVARAFHLARSGAVRGVAELKKALDREGHNSREIEGRAITGQLRELIKAARGAVKPEP